MGKKILIKTSNGETIEGELLYVRTNSIVIIPIYEPKYSLYDYIDLVETYKFSDLTSVTIINESSFSSCCLRIGGFSLIGFVTGGPFLTGGSGLGGLVGVSIILGGIVGGIVWENT